MFGHLSSKWRGKLTAPPWLFGLGRKAALLGLLGYAGSVSAVAVDPMTPVLTPAQDECQLLLSWWTEELRPYQIETSTNLHGWSEFGNMITGDGASRSELVPKLGPCGFYRLRKGAVRPGLDELAMSRGDDHAYPQPTSPEAALVSFGFPINFFGVTRTGCYINNNGNITFNGPLYEYTPEDLIRSSAVMIAPFWADVDSRNPLSEVTRFSGQPTAINGRPAFGVNWRDVGYFDQNIDKLNSFQLVIIERGDRNPGDFDIEFNYNRIEWETGDASGGVGGMAGANGAVARVGWTNGSGLFMEFRGSGTPRVLLDKLPDGTPNFANGLIYQTWNTSVPGRILIPVVNGLPQIPADLNFTISAGPDQVLDASAGPSFSLEASITPPEVSGVSFLWVLETNVSGVTLTNASSATPDVTISEPGQYQFRVYGTKQGDFLVSSSDSVIVNHPGVIQVFGGNYLLSEQKPPTVTLSDAVAKFNGENIANVHWVQTGGDAATISDPSAVRPVVTLPGHGYYRFRLTATTNHTPPFVRTAEASVTYGIPQ